MNRSPAVNVLVRHADSIVATGLTAFLSGQADMRVWHVEDGDASTGGAPCRAGVPFDVVVTDYETGVEFARQHSKSPDIWSESTHPRVLVLTQRALEWDARLEMNAGVHGYVLQDCTLAEIALGARMLAHGSRYVCNVVAARIADSLTREALTAREMRVLELVTQGCCNKAIARALGIAVGTVKSHLRKVHEKLGVATRTQAVAVASQRGLVLPTGSSERPLTREIAQSQVAASAMPLLTRNDIALLYDAA